MDDINQFLQNPSIKVELELTDQAQMRLIVVAIVITIIVLSASIIYKKLI
jgi:hypothetical protein